MKEYKNKNLQLRLLKKPNSTIILDPLTDIEAINLFKDSSVFNR